MFSKGSSQPRDRTQATLMALLSELPGKPKHLFNDLPSSGAENDHSDNIAQRIRAQTPEPEGLGSRPKLAHSVSL